MLKSLAQTRVQTGNYFFQPTGPYKMLKIKPKPWFESTTCGLGTLFCLAHQAMEVAYKEEFF